MTLVEIEECEEWHELMRKIGLKIAKESSFRETLFRLEADREEARKICDDTTKKMAVERDVGIALADSRAYKAQESLRDERLKNRRLQSAIGGMLRDREVCLDVMEHYELMILELMDDQK